MGVSEIGFPQNVVYKQRIQTSDTLPVTIGASKYCEFLFDIDAGDRMTPLGIVGWGCDDKTQVFLLDFYMDNDLQTAKLILKNPYATTIAINSLYIDVLYSKQALDMSEVDVVDNLTTDSAVAALSARQGKVLNEKIPTIANSRILNSGDLNDLIGAENAGFYYIQPGVTNAPQTWTWLLVMGGTGTAQLMLSQNRLYLRAYTGSPLAWTAWTTIVLSSL